MAADYSAAEVAGLLGTSTAVVNSALQRARAGLAGVPDESELAEPDDRAARELVDRYMRSFIAPTWAPW